MLGSLGLAALAFQVGFGMRRARLRSQRREPATRRSHLRVAKPAVVLLVLGFALGPLSMWKLRARDPFESVHGWLGVLAASLFVATGCLGRRLERGRSRRLDTHALLGALALLAAALAAVAGFVLLP